MDYFILRGIGLGFTAGTIPGPLHNLLINETLIRGFRRSFPILFTPLIADIPIILVAVLLLDRLPDTAVRAIQVAGGLFIFSLAWGTWRQARTASFQSMAAGGESESQSSLAAIMGRAVVVNWLSPGPYLFWGTILGPLMVDALEKSAGHALMLLLGFYMTFLGLMALVGIAFHQARRLDERWLRGMLRVSALILLLFGVSFILQGVGIA